MSARSLILNGLAQSDLDMNNFRLLNLNTSNLSISGLPPDVTPPPHNFLNGWIRATQTWSFAQPSFSDISGNLTLLQQSNIGQVGLITSGVWQASRLAPSFVPTLDNIQSPAADVSMNLKHLKNLANPVDLADAVNLQTMQSFSSGLQPKQAVAAASNGLNTSLSGLLPVDGYTPVDGDRILVKDQATGFHHQNGIYIAHVGSWVRATDADTSLKLVGALCNVLNGVANIGTAWVQITPNPINISGADNGTEPVFVLFGTAEQTISAGPGLQLMGSVMSAVGTLNRIAVGLSIDIDPAYAGQSSINTLGTVTKGVWSAGVIGAAYGGTGNANPGNISLIGNLNTTQVGGPPGALFLTLQLTGNTTVTLPISGTLATVSGNEILTNKHIDTSEIDTGVFPIARGGTGAATATLALINLLPPLAGQAGKSLKTDGTNLFWG